MIGGHFRDLREKLKIGLMQVNSETLPILSMSEEGQRLL